MPRANHSDGDSSPGASRPCGGAGGLAAEAQVRLVGGVDPRSAGLSVEEGFVLSRIDGTLTVEAVCLVTGLGREPTLELLARLRAKGLIQIGEDPPGGPPPRGPEPAPAADAEPPAAPQAAVDPEVDLKPELQAEILELYGRLSQLNLFELLGVTSEAGAKELRKAYFLRSKKFHPDRYYNKRLGRFKDMLQEIFKQLRAGYKFLEDEANRGEYRQMVIQQGEQEALARQVEAQGAEALARDQARAEQAAPAPEQAAPAPPVDCPRRRRRRRSIRAQVARDALVSMARSRSSGHHSAVGGGGGRAREDEGAGEALRAAEGAAGAAGRESHAVRAQRGEQFFRQGREQMDRGQHMAAVASLRLATTYSPESELYRAAYDQAKTMSRDLTADSYFKRGVFEESVGRLDAARVNFVKAVELAPRPLYLQRAAQAMLWTHDLINARDYATRAVRSDPVSIENRIILAKVYIGMRCPEDAARELREALGRAPGNAEAQELLKGLG